METVPLEVATPYLVSQNFANPSSKSSMYFPAEEIQFVFKQSLTYFDSFPIRLGSHTGINFLFEVCFFILPFSVRALLDFNHLGVFKKSDIMARIQQNNLVR